MLQDLDQRGLLEDTLVLWRGEFGRTPMAENGDGRNHHPQVFTVWMAGGGVRPGLTYGSSDDFGYHPVENPVHMHDLHATLLHALGLDHERLTCPEAATQVMRPQDKLGCRTTIGASPRLIRLFACRPWRTRHGAA